MIPTVVGWVWVYYTIVDKGTVTHNFGIIVYRAGVTGKSDLFILYLYKGGKSRKIGILTTKDLS